MIINLFELAVCPTCCRSSVLPRIFAGGPAAGHTDTQFQAVFLSRVSMMLTRDIDIAILFERLSVRNTLVLYENGLTYRHSYSSFTDIKHLHEIPTVSTPPGALNTGGV